MAQDSHGGHYADKAGAEDQQSTPRRAGLGWHTLTVALVIVAATAAGGAFSALVTYDLVGLGHLPRCAIFSVVILIGINALWTKVLKRRAFTRAQLAFVYVAVLVIAGIPGQQLVTYIYLEMVGSQYHAANQGNKYQEEVLPYLKTWMVPTGNPGVPVDHDDPGKAGTPFDPEQDVVAWAFHGMPYGARVPWRPWVRPLLLWMPYVLALLLLQLCLAALLRRRWDEERLTYPLAQAPVELISYDSGRQLVPALMRSYVFWGLFLIPVIVHTKNALAFLYPYSFSRTNLNANVGRIFGEAPWSNFDYLPLMVYFESIGAAYLIPAATGFSLWFFWLLRRVVHMYRDQRGFIEHPQYLQQQGIGAYLFLAALCLWGARKSLGRAFRGSFRRPVGESDHNPGEEPMHPRTAVWGVLLSLAVILYWGYHAGDGLRSLVPILVMMILYIAALIVLSRLVAECGLFCVWSPLSPPQEIVAKAWSAFGHPLSAQSTTTLAYMGYKIQDNASATMANVMQGYRIAEMVSIRARTVLLLMIAALVVAVFVSHPASLYAIYTNGVYDLGWWPAGSSESVPSSVHNMLSADVIEGGALTPYKTENGIAMIHGALVAAGLYFLRTQFHRFPLQPFAFAAALGPQFMMDRYGFSIFIGWCFKYFVLKYGGIRAHNKLRPAAFGLIVGNAVILLFWTIWFYFNPVEGVLVVE